MIRRATALLASLFLLAMLPGWALADAITTDQSNTYVDKWDQSASIYAQTFTAGIYGPLADVTLYFTTSSAVNLSVMIEDTTGNPPVPLDGSLATGSRPGMNTHGAQGGIGFDLSPQPILMPGHTYAIVIFAGSQAQVWGSHNDNYPRGRGLALHNLAWVPVSDVYPSGPIDFAFQTIMGAAAATPTPTTTPTPTPAPPSAPARTPTHAPTTAASLAPTPADSPTSAVTQPTLDNSTPDPAKAADTPSLTPTPLPAASTPVSGGPTDMTLPIVAALILASALGGSLIIFLLVRRRRSESGAVASGSAPDGGL